MSTLKVKDADGSDVYLEKTGAGTLEDPQAASVSLKAGAAIIGAVKDAGLNWTPSRQLTTSADMSAGADLTAAPTAGQKIVVDGLVVSAAAAMQFDLVEETSGTVLASFYLSANGTVTFKPTKMKVDTADKKIRGVASRAGNVSVTLWFHSEA